MQVNHGVLRRGSKVDISARGGCRHVHSRPRVVVCKNWISGLPEVDSDAAVEKKPKGMQEQLQAVVDIFLFRAASRVERGVATCLECKGSGQCMCSNCKGGGVTSPVKRSALAQGPVSHTIRGSEKGDQWLMTNRCLKCRGRGNTTCGSCDGTGLRAPPIVQPLIARKTTNSD